MKIRRYRTLFAAVSLAISSSSCVYTDYYAQVQQDCSYHSPLVGYPAYGASTPGTTLTAQCKTTLESVIPYDSTWDQAPDGLKASVDEAFQALVAYPVQFPAENTLYGTKPTDGGVYPTAWLNQFAAPQDVNRALFDYVLNAFDTVVYDATTTSGNITSYYTVEPTFQPRTLKILSLFQPQGDEYWNHVPFVRAAILIHEARHGDGYTHVLCPGGTNTFECDPSFDGPFGVETAYLQAVLLASGSAPAVGQSALIPHEAVAVVNRELCNVAKQTILVHYEQLDSLLDPIDCGLFDYDWLVQHLGITPSPN